MKIALFALFVMGAIFIASTLSEAILNVQAVGDGTSGADRGPRCPPASRINIGRGPNPPDPPRSEGCAPLQRSANNDTNIPGQYIMAIKRDLTEAELAECIEEMKTNGYKVMTVGKSSYVRVNADNEEKLDDLRRNRCARFVEQDQRVKKAAEENCISKTPGSWGLDRIDESKRALDGVYTITEPGATSVCVYIVDSGIEITDPEFDGRAVWGTNTIDDIDTDCDGHGTFVAGIVGSNSYGVASTSSVTLVAVKTLDCTAWGSIVAILDGLNWVDVDSQTRCIKSVINMSFASNGVVAVVDDAIQNLHTKGIPSTVAAGNNAGDACDISPALEPTALTVGAVDKTDCIWPYSNTGDCVDLYAPGVNIISTFKGEELRAGNGTSFGTPFVAGVLALKWTSEPSMSVTQLTDWLKGTAKSKTSCKPKPKRPNKLLYYGCGS